MQNESGIIVPGGMTPQELAARADMHQAQMQAIDIEGRLKMADVMARIAAPLVAWEVQMAIRQSTADDDGVRHISVNFDRALDQAEVCADAIMGRCGFSFKRDHKPGATSEPSAPSDDVQA